VSDILEDADYNKISGSQAIITGDFNVLRRPTSQEFHEKIIAQNKEFESPMDYIENKEYEIL